MERELTIQDVAEATGLTAHTLRYYERAGLLAPIPRNQGGHRRYRELDVDALLFLMRLRMTGMPIHQVRQYAALTREGAHTIDERRALLEAHRESVRQRILELGQNLAALDYKIGLYERGWTPQGGANDPCLRELRQLCAAPGSERMKEIE
jgi:DNA-binding transcriptional MerR regulator